MALKKSKPRRALPSPDINITSLMDVLTTLIFFIIMMAAMNKFAAIPANPLHSGKPTEADNRPVFALKVAIMGDRMAQVYLGPIKGLEVNNAGATEKYLKANFTGAPDRGYNKTITEKSKEALINRLLDVLVKLKEAFPNEMKAVVAFGGKVTYQMTVDSLAAVRSLPPGRNAVPVRGSAGKTELTRVLFPSVIVAEWSEE